MENWRKTTVEILRECPEEIHLEELYKKVKPFINDLVFYLYIIFIMNLSN